VDVHDFGGADADGQSRVVKGLLAERRNPKIRCTNKDIGRLNEFVEVGLKEVSPPLQAALTWSSSRRSPMMALALGSPLSLTSKTLTSYLSTRASTMWRPRNPAPPVTRHWGRRPRMATLGWIGAWGEGGGVCVACSVASLFMLLQDVGQLLGRWGPLRLRGIDHVRSLQCVSQKDEGVIGGHRAELCKGWS
jgi:hypothetical protein